MPLLQLSILIPTKDRTTIVENCIRHCIKAIEGISAEIIVVNDSKNSTLKLSFDSSIVSLFDNPKSGVAAARNYAASKAQGEILLFLDDDMLVYPENIQSTLHLHATKKDYFLNLDWTYPPELEKKIAKTKFGRYLIAYGFNSLKGWNRNLPWEENSLFEVNGLTSQYFSCSKFNFTQLGGYDEKFPLAGYEDLDLYKRILALGHKVYINSNSLCYHNEEDRCDINSWMERKRRGGITRRVASDMGYKEIALTMNFGKTMIYKVLVNTKSFYFFLWKLLPNLASFDFISFRFINLLLGIHIFEGYNTVKK
jgi:glycosyltransferase involved in cell wall biosynthesis